MILSSVLGQYYVGGAIDHESGYSYNVGKFYAEPFECVCVWKAFNQGCIVTYSLRGRVLTLITCYNLGFVCEIIHQIYL